jgi:alkanesulfonate monooxygenase SsuD/methylene tetrahydromethanopterin reductase-like flavin-dependent oxidoreductase (luciferase family)
MLIGDAQSVQPVKDLAFGVHLPIMGLGRHEPTKEEILSSAIKAEDLGFDSLSVNDHIAYRTSWVDSLSALASAAAVTHRIRLGTSILNIVIRNPVVSANALSAVDILSSGRLFAGIGPGSHKGDYEASSIPFEERWGRFRESLEILTSLWSNESIDYSGQFYKLERVSIKPGPIQKPHPPIMVGSWGSEIMLRRIARYANGWMASAYNITPESLAEKCKLLQSYVRENNREVDSFETSVMTMFSYISPDEEKVHKTIGEVLSPALGRSQEELKKLLLFGSPSECIPKIRRLLDAGARRIHFWPVRDYTEQIEILAKEIIPAFK